MGIKVVSVIVPVYQAELYIERCLDSLQNQTYRDVEIILVDDGSTDGSYLKCIEKSKEDSRIIVLQHQKQEGVSRARNDGLDHAHGEFIMFCDADDQLERNTIADMVEAMENSAAGVCICGYKRIKQGKLLQSCLPFGEKAECLLEEQEFYHYFWSLFESRILHNIGTKLYRKSIIDEYGIRFRDGYVVCEDILFCLDYIAQISRVQIVNQALYCYMFDNASSANKSYRKELYDHVVELNYIIEKMIVKKEGKYYKNTFLNLYSVIRNEFYCKTRKKEAVLEAIRMVCEDSFMVETRNRIELKTLNKEERIMCRAIWGKHIYLIYFFFRLKNAKKACMVKIKK